LGLQHAELLIGEHFPQLADIIASAGQALLLFPDPDGDPLTVLAQPPVGHPPLLIVPDGTWRKARKIVHDNPILNTLPRLSLPPGEPSRYRVRKATEPGAVATIEAIVRALAVLEPQQDFHPLLQPFEVLVDQQIDAMGDAVYRRNHSSWNF